jgi:N-acetylgalactosamine kinase
VDEWLVVFSRNHEPVQRFMLDTYGSNGELHAARRSAYLKALAEYARQYSYLDQVFLVRSPGRLNLMGRHIDHRGGYTNVVAISEEAVMVCSAREDDSLVLHNADQDRYPAARFSVSRETSRLGGGDWQQVITRAQDLAARHGGDWSNYFRAAALRLQAQFSSQRLRGLNVLVHGTIPPGAGLSSSSALVVGASEALIASNSLPVHANLQVDLCGEGEWFVGTRGGAGDHAAIKFGRRGQIVRLSFLPFEVCGNVPFLPGHCVVVCNSGVEARKSEKARHTFNSKILGYALAEISFRQEHPRFADRVERFRDLCPHHLGLELAELYGLLESIPERITLEEFYHRYPRMTSRDRDTIANIASTLGVGDQLFEVRGVMLFGLAECARSEFCAEYLETGNAEGFGTLWYASHDGDRVVQHDENLRPQPWRYQVSAEYLQRLARGARSSEAEEREGAKLRWQPGAYSCSTPELDLIVDVARRLPGVKGAQMAGAGLGGCAMILAEEPAAEEVIATLSGHGFSAARYDFVEGAGLVIV